VTTVLYGTARSEDALLAQQRAANLRDDPEAHFEFPWTVLGELSSAYAAFVSGEIRRLGADHPAIKTQYLLEAVEQGGRLFSASSLALVKGSHERGFSGEEEDGVYVAGVDVAGESEGGPDDQVRSRLPRRDSTVVTIARVTRPEELLGEPLIEIVEQQWWTGRDHATQYTALRSLLESCSYVCVDATGVGAGVASWLARAFRSRVEAVQFTRPLKSEMGYELLAAVKQQAAADGLDLGACVVQTVQRYTNEANDEEWVTLIGLMNRTDDPSAICLKRAFEHSFTQLPGAGGDVEVL